MMKWLMSWDNAVNPERADMVFANRNKEYGAYDIRKKYETRMIRALLVAMGIIVLAVGGPILGTFLSDRLAAKKAAMSEEVTLAEPPPIDKTIPPPPPVIPPPPVVQTIKFTPPKVVKDEEVKEEPPPTQEEMKDVQISTETHEGEKTVDLPPETPVVDEDAVMSFATVEEQPQFPGGEAKLLQYVSEHIKYPPVARENGIQGRVYVTFIVDKEGKIADAKILRGIGGGCDEEALRVVKALPEWKPGKQNGRAVKVQFNLPVNFTLK
jgi:protein TonB